MSNEITDVGDAFRADRARGVRMLAHAIRVCGGNLRHAAAMLALSRRHLYRLIYREDLEAYVARCRREARGDGADPEWLVSTRAAIEEAMK